jgi:hypothetical protein
MKKQRYESLALSEDLKPPPPDPGRMICGLPLHDIVIEALGMLFTIIAITVSFLLLFALVDTPHPVPDANGGVTWVKN